MMLGLYWEEEAEGRTAGLLVAELWQRDGIVKRGWEGES